MTFLSQYFDGFNSALSEFIEFENNRVNLDSAVEMLKQTKADDKTIYLIGNGGSSAIAEHMAIDLTKNAKLRATTFSGTPFLTTLANDCGYDKAYQKCVETFVDKGDVVIAISSSGQSENILNACKSAKSKGAKVITFAGFKSSNPLNDLGDLNFWVNSESYGYVEILHNLIIHYINDAIIGSAYYSS